MNRIAKGLWRHTLACNDPFIVPLRGTSKSHTSTHSVAEPASTISGGGTHHALVQPTVAMAGCLTEHANGSTSALLTLLSHCEPKLLKSREATLRWSARI